jgi:hypothetical protein
MLQKQCIECNQWLSFEEFTYGHDCEEVKTEEQEDEENA